MTLSTTVSASSGRSERRVDDLDLDAVLGETVGHRQRAAHGVAVGDDREVAALAHDLRAADRHREVVARLGQRAVDVVEHEVLDEQHGIVVADRRLEQAVGVERRRRRDDLEAGRVREHHLEALRVLGRQLRAGAGGRADHERHADLAAEHLAHLGRVVHDHVHGHEDEVDRHDLDDRPQAEHRGAHAGADEALLGDRRLAHAPRAVLRVEAGRDLVGALEAADLLAHEEDLVVARELLVERAPQGLAVGHARHARVPSRSPNGPPRSMRENCSRQFGSP